MRLLKGTALTLSILYLLVCVLLYTGQESMIFHPQARGAEHSYGEFPESYVEVEPGVRLNVLTVPATAKGQAPGAILYLHGNRGDNGRSLGQTQGLRGLGYDLILVDYRGFGKSGGGIGGEENMTEDLRIVYDSLVGVYGEGNLVIVGYSLGTGPASYLAANNDPRGVVLVAPFTSLTDMKNEWLWMFPDFLLTYELNNFRHLSASTCPVTILHGEADELIPVRMGEALAGVGPGRIELIRLPGAGHRGAIFSDRLAPAVAGMIGGNDN